MSHNYPEMRERIDETTAVSTAGEIILVADTADPHTRAMSNWARIERMRSHGDPYDAEIDEYYREQDAAAERERNMREIREGYDPSERNDFLFQASKELSRWAKASAAATAMDNGVQLGGAYGGTSAGAERAAANRHAAAINLAAKACRACQLADFCSLKPDELVSMIEPTDVRRRFRGRVEKNSNDHLCETNAKAARLNKDAS